MDLLVPLQRTAKSFKGIYSSLDSAIAAQREESLRRYWVSFSLHTSMRRILSFWDVSKTLWEFASGWNQKATRSNVTSVAEDEVLRILVLVRNFAPGWKQVSEGGWNVAAVVHHAYDLIDRTVGTVGGGRIGQELMKRLKGFGLKEMLYYDRNSLGAEREKELGCKRETDLDTMLSKCDVVVVNTPLTDQTRGLFNKERIAKMKKGAYLVNNARGAIADTEAVKEACESGHLGGYGGDVWNAQPAGKDHPWRYMPNHAMTPHISGTTLDAQKRFAAGTKDMIDRWLKHEAFPEQNYIVREGKLASQYL
uniref:D-isomer specific 2-hydroxyacid dehydrogenase NAD-binding domain-containing protein n=1 Tax=Physcomitrium patens TaxID=3218 RepID=A0A7I4B1Q7_PHYPA